MITGLLKLKPRLSRGLGIGDWGLGTGNGGGEISRPGPYCRVASEGFEDLEVYRLAARLSDELRGAVGQWESVDVWSVGIQMIRAADAIGADIAEAYGRGTRPDQARFLFMARGSALELQHWIARATARQLPCPQQARQRADRIGRMLSGLIRARGRSPDQRAP
jgi:four helix bundle protein